MVCINQTEKLGPGTILDRFFMLTVEMLNFEDWTDSCTRFVKYWGHAHRQVPGRRAFVVLQLKHFGLHIFLVVKSGPATAKRTSSCMHWPVMWNSDRQGKMYFLAVHLRFDWARPMVQVRQRLDAHTPSFALQWKRTL